MGICQGEQWRMTTRTTGIVAFQEFDWQTDEHVGLCKIKSYSRGGELAESYVFF